MTESSENVIVSSEANVVESTALEVEPDRKLATVTRILDLTPITGADRIELATVYGWQVIVSKNDNFKVGDLCIYYMIDTMFEPEYHRTVNILKGKQLKTIKMRGVISQGLVSPVDWLADYGTDPTSVNEGDDVTQIMKLKKYVAPEEEGQYSTTRNTFPRYINKTDEERIQNIPRVLRELDGKEIVITRKEDGCSATFILNSDDQFVMCSRNTTLVTEDNSNTHYFKIADTFKLEERLRAFGRHLGLQGEIVGPKVNGNRLLLTELDFKIFSIYDIDEMVYLSHDEVQPICEALGLHHVPILYKGLMCDRFDSVAKLLEFAGSLEYSKGRPAEGIVVRTNQRSPRNSFKVISNKYLLKHDL